MQTYTEKCALCHWRLDARRPSSRRRICRVCFAYENISNAHAFLGRNIQKGSDENIKDSFNILNEVFMETKDREEKGLVVLQVMEIKAVKELVELVLNAFLNDDSHAKSNSGHADLSAGFHTVSGGSPGSK